MRGAAAGAASEMAPPFRLPGQHFAAGVVFLVLGAAGLVWAAPSAAGGAFSSPRVVAVVHLFTLGWITTSIMGALYQLLPVALGAPVRSEGLGHLSFWLYAPGVVAFVAGLLFGGGRVTLAGASLAATGLVLFVANLGATLPRAERGGLTRWVLAAAGLFLLATVTLGLLLAVNLRSDALGGGRFLVVGLHAHVAAGGWVLMVVIGVADRLMPMFLLSHGAPEWPGRAAAVLVGLGAGVLTTIGHLLPASWTPVGGALLAAGTAAFLVQCVLHYRGSLKPELDPGMRLVAVGLGFLSVALLLGSVAMLQGPSSPRLVAGYGAALLVGGFGLFVAGHYYKILPFLVWFHRFGPVAAERDVPQVGELFDHWWAGAATLLLGAGTAGLIAALVTGSEPGARLASLSLAAGVGVMAVQMLRISRRRPGPAGADEDAEREPVDPEDARPGSAPAAFSGSSARGGTRIGAPALQP